MGHSRITRANSSEERNRRANRYRRLAILQSQSTPSINSRSPRLEWERNKTGTTYGRPRENDRE